MSEESLYKIEYTIWHTAEVSACSHEDAVRQFRKRHPDHHTVMSCEGKPGDFQVEDTPPDVS